MKRKPLISVIIPVYNVEQFIEKCLETVINQTYKNIEILIVNDGSTDKSKSICELYQKKDNRIKLFNKKNGGLSDARNYAIDYLKGEYVTFIDSDDYVEEDFIEHLYELIEKYDVDISVCSYSVISKNKIIECGKKYESKKMNKVEAYRNMLEENGFSVSAWGKLYKSSLFNNIRYPKGKLCEDNGTTYKLMDQVDYIYFSNRELYKYSRRTGSIMLSTFSIKKLDMIELTDEMCDFLEIKYEELKDVTKRRRIYSRFNVLRQSIFGKYAEKEKIEKELIEYLKANSKIIFSNKFPARDRIAMIMLLIHPLIFKFGWIVYLKIKY